MAGIAQTEPCPLTVSRMMVIRTAYLQLQCGLSPWKQQPVCRLIIPIACFCGSLGRPLVQAAATRCPRLRSRSVSSKKTTTTPRPCFSTYLLQLEEFSITPLQAMWPQLILTNSILYRMMKFPTMVEHKKLFVIPQSLQQLFLEDAHYLARHPGMDRTLTRLMQTVSGWVWSKMLAITAATAWHVNLLRPILHYDQSLPPALGKWWLWMS